ncbi:MAG: IclR family transcriptional regulator [Ilumatobacteraceae bacterium]
MEGATLSSVDHALAILQLLRSVGSVRVLDVARELGVANSTAHRLLAALVARGFARQDPATRRYLAGDELLEIGRASVLHDELVERVRPALQQISSATGETVHLGVREGTVVRYVDAVESTRAVRVVARTGRALPAHWTSTGKVLLAALDDDVLRRLYPRDPLPAGTAQSIRTVAGLLADVERCRRLGYAVNTGESEDDVVSIAVPVTDAHGTTVASISCAIPRHRIRQRDVPALAKLMLDVIQAKVDLG